MMSPHASERSLVQRLKSRDPITSASVERGSPYEIKNEN
jgi:hypothetical protein